MGVINADQVAPLSKTAPTDSENRVRVVQQWLAWLGPMLVDVGWLAMVEVSDAVPGDAGSIVSGKWPADASLPAGLNLLAERAAANQQVVQAQAGKAIPSQLLAIPLQTSSVNSACKHRLLLLGSKQLDTNQQQTLIQLCRWAFARLEMPDEPAARRNPASHTAQPTGYLATAMLDAVVRHRSIDALAIGVVNAAASGLGCRRVSLGLVEQDRINVIAVSGQSRIDKRRDVIRQLAEAMCETVSHQRSLQYPAPDEDVQLAAHARLFVQQGQHACLSVRLPRDGKDKVVVLLERARGKKFNATQVAAIEKMLAPLAPLLAFVQDANATPLQALLQSAQRASQALRVRDVAWRKAGVLVAGLLILFAGMLPVSHQVTANASIEAADRQVVVAPHAGYVQSSHARAGDQVKAGQLLAALDSRTLALEADKWRSERMKNEQQYATALAVHDRAELSRLRADVVRIDAELALIEQQLARSELRAPFAGVLLSGDLSQSLGAPVQAGDVLFEVASANRYRLLLDVDERDAGFISSGQTAQLRMASLPDKTWQAELEDVLPVAVVEQGSSVFRLPATLQRDASELRPGMQGIARIRVGSRSLLWVYTHSLLDRLRLLAWKLGFLS